MNATGKTRVVLSMWSACQRLCSATVRFFHPSFSLFLSFFLSTPKSVYVYAGRVIATNYPNDDTIKISRQTA
ncbi:hypothetical protein PUN28_007599 [Cardiocondyla obscurior]|uniref:Secreted protein n=1 Tax=Cardiocondyla obscurior TaxID=286306 RepID=A0AAW2G4V9_9HYME